ncbi:hypothetical protein CSUI_001599 [Cystoisospora suis]|uniref:DUF2423 domain-containing protein n=1 Tax=Cystoisospora suis TaxID=483139 RepID=A0A2C6LCC8_9APIC|nr:hypothetical protein CSUI_001599 [Cystoisospora suis]
MAKGLRAKCKRRYRAVKRQHVQQTVEKSRLQEIHSKLQLLQQGDDLTHLGIRPPNAFLHPDSPDAVFPQKLPGPPPLDFRCEKLGLLAGLASTHNRRKYTREEEENFMEQYSQLPGKTEDARTYELRKKLIEKKKRSQKEGEDSTMLEEEEEEGEEENEDLENTPESHMIECTDTSGNLDIEGGAERLGSSSMFMTPEMREMMDRRRKEESAKLPVKVNLLKKKKIDGETTRMRKKTGKGKRKK